MATLGSSSAELFVDELVKAHLVHLLVTSTMEAQSCIDQDLPVGSGGPGLPAPSVTSHSLVGDSGILQ